MDHGIGLVGRHIAIVLDIFGFFREPVGGVIGRVAGIEMIQIVFMGLLAIQRRLFQSVQLSLSPRRALLHLVQGPDLVGMIHHRSTERIGARHGIARRGKHWV